jgi:hypothetical protein
MAMPQTGEANGGLSLRAAALTAGLGLLVMAVCAPLATFYFLPKGVVSGDGAATLAQLRSNGAPYLIGVLLLFVTYVMDVIVAWALYWLLRPNQLALSQLCAWLRLVYTGLAFTGLLATFSAFALAQATNLADQVSDAALQSEILFRLSAANAISSIALTFFGVHLLILSVAIWRSAYIPKWIAIAVSLAGVAYPVYYMAQYIAPTLQISWLLAFALGELIFMGWMLVAGWRLPRAHA